MTTVAKGVLKAKMLEYFRQVEETGEELIVTDHRKPVLKVIPIAPVNKDVKDVFADLRSKVVYHEDITAPTSDEWGEI